MRILNATYFAAQMNMVPYKHFLREDKEAIH